MERGLTHLTHKNKAKKEKRCAFEGTHLVQTSKVQKCTRVLGHVLHVEQCRIVNSRKVRLFVFTAVFYMKLLASSTGTYLRR